MKKLFDNPKPAVYAIIIFLILFFSIRSCEASGVELGATLLDGYGLVYAEDINKFSVGVMLISNQSWDGIEEGNNGGIFIQRIVRYKNFSMGLGAASWINTSRVIGAHIGFHLSLHYDINEKFSLNVRHWSNAGTSINNRGQDLVTIGWEFN